MEITDAVNLLATLVSQSESAFEMAIKAEACFKDFQRRNWEFVDKSTKAEEKRKKAKVEAEAVKGQCTVKAAKLESALAKF